MFNILLLLTSLLATPIFAHAESIRVGQFSAGTLHGWEEKEFDGKTEYQLVVDETTQQKVLQAQSSKGASS